MEKLVSFIRDLPPILVAILIATMAAGLIAVLANVWLFLEMPLLYATVIGVVIGLASMSYALALLVKRLVAK